MKLFPPNVHYPYLMMEKASGQQIGKHAPRHGASSPWHEQGHEQTRKDLSNCHRQMSLRDRMTKCDAIVGSGFWNRGRAGVEKSEMSK